MITKEEFIKKGFRYYVCDLTNQSSYKYDCEDYHITISTITYGKDDRYTCHIDGNDFSTIGFGYISSFDDLEMILRAIGEKPM